MRKTEIYCDQCQTWIPDGTPLVDVMECHIQYGSQSKVNLVNFGLSRKTSQNGYGSKQFCSFTCWIAYLWEKYNTSNKELVAK